MALAALYLFVHQHQKCKMKINYLGKEPQKKLWNYKEIITTTTTTTNTTTTTTTTVITNTATTTNNNNTIDRDPYLGMRRRAPTSLYARSPTEYVSKLE